MPSTIPPLATANLVTPNFPKLDDLNKVLHFALPSVCGLIIPLSLLNIVVMLNLGVQTSPSTLIYFAMILMDLLNALTGILITADPESKHWKGVESNIYLFTFDATIVLIFGLAVVRVVCIKMSALSVLANLRILAYAAVISSLIFGGFAVYYPHLLKTKSFVDFAWLDLLDLLIVFCTVIISFYTWFSVRRRRNLININMYKSASSTCLFITLSFIASYSYYAFLNTARLYYILHNLGCPPNSWMMVFVCRDSLFIGVSAMCLQSLTNNVILLCQDHVRRFVRKHVVMCWVDVKRKCRGRRNQGYLYFEDLTQ